LFIEVQAFCIEFSRRVPLRCMRRVRVPDLLRDALRAGGRIREAAGLYRLLATVRGDADVVAQ
jgi:hypothetical protein